MADHSGNEQEMPFTVIDRSQAPIDLFWSASVSIAISILFFSIGSSLSRAYMGGTQASLRVQRGP